MSAELTKARSLLSGINSHLKQGKLIPAAQALHDATLIVLKSPLMKGEKEEFTRLIDHGVFLLGQDAKLRQLFPLKLEYQSGGEKELLGVLGDLMKELQANKSEEVQGLLADMLKKKEEALQQIRALLAAGNAAEAKKLGDKLVRDHGSSTDILTEVADIFVKAESYSEAFQYLDQALKNDPNAIHLYNRIGIVLRKMRDFETAEKYYQRALETGAKDEYLWFNIGRLYLDWQRFDKMVHAAERALKINPEFVEAQKMLAFAKKKLG